MIKIATFVYLSYLLVFVLFGFWLYEQIPSEVQIQGCLVTKMFNITLCPTDKQNYIPINQISPFMVKALVLTEDSLFYQHKGFDWESIQKSFEQNTENKKIVRGGSTITQQLAKNMFLSKEKSYVRKIFEAIITVKIEKALNKNQILERYLNVVEFGKDLYGIKKAAEFYFHKSPSELDVTESAFLTMLLPNPIKYSQSFHKGTLTPFARGRITTIIENLYQYNRISQTEFDQGISKIEHIFGSKTLNSNNKSEDQNKDENPESLSNEIDNAIEESIEN